MAQWFTNPTGTMTLQVQSLALLSGLRSCGVGRRHGSDPVWLWPVATARTGPLACDPPYAMGTALEKTKKKKSPCFALGMCP